MNIGLIFAFLACLAWGFGDFFIQRTSRRFGELPALFFITLSASVLLLPFILSEFRGLERTDYYLLFGTSFVIFIVALLEFRALRIGKLSVIEPVYALELPITAMLSITVLRENLSLQQTALIIILIIGIALVSTKSFSLVSRCWLERGVLIAVLATAGMGVVNFLFGVAARNTSPLMINWFTSAFILAMCSAYFVVRGGFSSLLRNFREQPGLISVLCVTDNAAWIFYAYSTVFIPVALATSISESYIALAALLGILVSKESLRKHQVIGLIVTVICAVLLGSTLE